MIKDYNMETTIKNGELVNKSTQLQVDLDLGNLENVKKILWEELNQRWTFWFEIHPDDLPPRLKGLSEDDLYHLQRFYDELQCSLKLTEEEIEELTN